VARQAVGLAQLHRAAAAAHGLLARDRRCQEFRARVTGEGCAGRAESGCGAAEAVRGGDQRGEPEKVGITGYARGEGLLMARGSQPE
jgi:hypothetical protein